jgi:5'-3' exonuclease
MSENGKKLSGHGQSFFYAQCLMGDSIDSIPGLGGRTGPVKAFKILQGCTTLDEMYKAVLEAYRGMYGDDAEDMLLEQGRLLWMTRELDMNGNPILWHLPSVETLIENQIPNDIIDKCESDKSEKINLTMILGQEVITDEEGN